MDNVWRNIYDENALRDVPPHTMSCWSEDGFEELFKITFNIIKDLTNIKTVLDVGCGPGEYCAELHKQGFNVTGIDYAKNVITKAKNTHPQIKFEVGTAYALPYEDNSFDLVICIGVLQCVYDSEKLIKELARVSKKYIIISTLLRRTKLENPQEALKQKLKKDTWPTREYHPTEIETPLEREGYSTKTITKNKKKPIKDGFFTLATKKQ